MLAVYTIVEPAATDGWGAGRTLLFGAIAVALLTGFVVREATAAQPLVPLRIFRSRNVTGANVIQVLSVAGMFGMFFLGALSVHGDYVGDVLPTMILLGLGGGMAFPALMSLAMSGATPQDAGLASGLVNTTAQVGGALGLAVLATLAATRTDTLVTDGEAA